MTAPEKLINLHEPGWNTIRTPNHPPVESPWGD